MAALSFISQECGDSGTDETLFALIAEDIEKQGFSIRHGALPEDMASALYAHQLNLNGQKYIEAGIGRGENYLVSEFVRTDEICWINGDSPAGSRWIGWTGQLQQFLNRRLFLGLFSFESHFAHYAPGAYYKRHYDAFRGQTNRVLTVVAYLNPSWTNEDGGELVLYRSDQDREGTRVTPLFGTLVVFLSEEYPHEVLPAARDRYSIAGWYRVNSSQDHRVDPPR
ncbi:2OG-Fe(II) oxygenase [Reinekea marinisedimentorum]|uniref:SM-20-related protein n=1 Tax=Reinekea marinisedimentorum TaxID=230495 RepID=A0A4R3I403_9GAMM|nr:2OG-Fe(II) oxygenase [Reinekea marinisedimentorum]TCS40456.1 SM-20-related protein [Reinekea marinisedimentorum]